MDPITAAVVIGLVPLAIIVLVLVFARKCPARRGAQPAKAAPARRATVSSSPPIPRKIPAPPPRREVPFGPGAGFDFAIVGESSYLGTLRRAGGQRLAAGETVVLEMLIVPEPENQFDENAVAVHAKGFGKVGYFSRDDAQEWAVVMAGLKILGGVATCEGWLRGGTGDKKNIGVWLSIKGVDEIEAEMAGWTT